MSASTPTAPGSATRLWNGEELDEAARARIVGLYRLTFRDPGVVLGQGQGRTHLSDIGDDGGADAAHEAAESRDRPADRPSGGGVVSILPVHTQDPGRRRGRAAQGAVAMDRLRLEARDRAGRAAGCGAVDRAGERRRAARPSTRGRPQIDLYRTETTNYRDNLASGAPCFGSRCGRPGSSRPMTSSR